MDADAAELRVVGCLLEKQRATPDAYPLSLNALRLACNQATNREPVVEYDEATVVEALRRTALKGWTRLASGAGSRARKYRHLMDEALDADGAELSLLAVLMLRGAQTPGELKQRTERLHDFADLAAVQETLERLVERGYAERCRAGRGRRRSATGSCSATKGPRLWLRRRQRIQTTASTGSSGSSPGCASRSGLCGRRWESRRRLRRRGSRRPAPERGGSKASPA